MKNLTLLVGIPASGKSTWRAANVTADTVVISTDDMIEMAALSVGKTYNDVFSEVVDAATSAMNTLFRQSLKTGANIVIDRTNLTPKSRAQWIREARNAGYWIEAVVFKRPQTQAEHDEWNRRLDRPGKTIPTPVLVDMYCSFKAPTLDEVDAFNTLDSYREIAVGS